MELFIHRRLRISFLWLNQIREKIYLDRGSTPVKLKDIFLGYDIFRKSKESLLSQAQSNISNSRKYLMNLISESSQNKEKVVDLYGKRIILK